jgi:hypothetical protein
MIDLSWKSAQDDNNFTLNEKNGINTFFFKKTHIYNNINNNIKK